MPPLLTPRLQAVAELILPQQSVADIGTDHAYLPVYLVEHGLCPQAIAVDCHRGPWQSACRLVEQRGLTESISVRLGDGLTVLAPGEAATVCIAGMGGLTTLEILQQSLPIVARTKRLVLQPQRHLAEVRRWLAAHDWQIIAERCVLDHGLYYQLLAAEPGQMCLTDAEAEFGPLLLARRDPLLREFVHKQLVTCRELLVQLDACGDAVARRQELRQREAFLAELLIEQSRSI